MIRSFLAIEIPEELRKKIYESFARLHRQLPDVKWVDPSHMHLTLRFLGNVEEKMLDEDLSPRLSQLATKFSAMNFALKGIGLFPSIQKPKVFWLGLAGDLVPLKRLQHQLVNVLSDLPFQAEQKEFQPHISLGRIKALSDRSKWQKALEEYEKVELGTFQVTHFALFKSQLTSLGPLYTKLKEFHFSNEFPKSGN